jgi:hypothetical protein
MIDLKALQHFLEGVMSGIRLEVVRYTTRHGQVYDQA